jgi:tRNA(Ile)-lysidine synthase
VPRSSASTTNAHELKDDLAQRFSRALTSLGFLPGCPAALGVSGGGDSLALAHLFAAWARRHACAPPVVLIVDHGLRDESPAEAALAAQWVEDAGLTAHILTWAGEKPGSNIEDQARQARYRLMGDWCAGHAVTRLFVAHTAEDQAETFLLRLGRGSGVDGLSGMRANAPLPMARFTGVRLLRPLLDMSRSELRVYLKERNASWLEDPMNHDLRFARVRVRKVLNELEAAGISAPRIAEAAGHLARAREALDAATEQFLDRHARFETDCALIDGAALSQAHREIGLRALAAVLMRFANVSYRPRFERLEALFDAIGQGGGQGIGQQPFTARTLVGCRIGKATKARALFGPGTLLIAHEGSRRVSRPESESPKAPNLPSGTDSKGPAELNSAASAP